MAMQTVSRDEVLRMAERLAGEYGESLTLTAFRRETGVSQWAIFDLFGNWKNLRQAAGLTPEAPRWKNRIPKERIVELLREQAKAQGRDITERGFLKATGLSGRLIADRFGSWGALRQLVGLEVRARIRPQYSYEDIMEDMLRVFRRYRCRPVYCRHRIRGGRIHPQTIRDRFGSWREACQAFQEYLWRRGVPCDDVGIAEG